MRHAPGRPGAGDGGQIDIGLQRALAHRRAGQWLLAVGAYSRGRGRRGGLRRRLALGLRLGLAFAFRRLALRAVRLFRLLRGVDLGILGLGLGLVLHVVGDFALDIDDQDFGPDRDDLTGLADDLLDRAVHRAGNFHRRLVGHHVQDVLVLGDRVAFLDVPLDDFRLDDAFADIGKFVLVLAHGQTAFVTASIARMKRDWIGK